MIDNSFQTLCFLTNPIFSKDNFVNSKENLITKIFINCTSTKYILTDLIKHFFAGGSNEFILHTIFASKISISPQNEIN